MTNGRSPSGSVDRLPEVRDDASVVRHMKRQARDWRCRHLDVGAAIAHDVRKGMERCRRKVLNYGYKGWNAR
jgi:hypothetical protein